MTKTLTIQKQVLDRIRTANMRPTSRAYFKIRDVTFWSLLILFIGALSLGFGMVLFLIKNTDFGIFDTLGLSAFERVAYSVPSFWIILSLVVAFFAFVNLRSTKRGYRISARQFVIIAAITAVILGSIFYALNVTKYVDDVASEKVPLYNAVVPLNTNTWVDTEHGLLSGIVRERNSNNDFMLRDSSAVLWHVVGTPELVPEGFNFHSGDRIKIIGEKLSDDTFSAIEIHPWNSR